ncbi:hypothetical protein [Synechococcus sp. 1G10]|uniref:beta strand repeat-containing protein n=1 Tax=Synechococcus sp. 1G10 TaxID=2025605 RepID=UPI00117DF47E|nr:hypothetical protein [Synechococcus sp. 1G10]
MTNLPAFSIGTEGTPDTLVAVVPGPASNSSVYDNIVATAPFANQINAKNLVVGGGFYIDLSTDNDTIRVKPATGAFFPPTGDLFGPNTLYMFGGEIDMDAGNDLIRVDATLVGEDGPCEQPPGIYMGAKPGSSGPGVGPIPFAIDPSLPLFQDLPFIFPALGGNSILMGLGNDTIEVAALADGVVMDGIETGDGNLIQFGAGEDLLDIVAGRTALSMRGSSNYVYMGADNDTIAINMSGGLPLKADHANAIAQGEDAEEELLIAGIYMEGGDNGISLQEGNDVIDITGLGYYGIFSDTGHIYTGQGADLVNVENDGLISGYSGEPTPLDVGVSGGYGVYLSESGLLALGADNDTLRVRSTQTALTLSYGSLLKGGSGNDLVDLDSSSTTSSEAVYLAYGSSILLGAGDDTLKVLAATQDGDGVDVYYGSKIDAGEGNDLISIESTEGEYGLYISSGSAVYLGAGNDTLTIKSGEYGIYASEGALIDLGDGDNLLSVYNADGSTETGIYLYESSLIAGTGNDTVKVESAYAGVYVSASNVKLGAGNNLVDIDSDYYSVYALNSNINFGDGDNGAGNDTLKLLSNSSYGLYLSYSALAMGGGSNLITIDAAEEGIDLEYGANIVFGEGADTIKVVSRNNDYDGIYLYSGSGIYLSNGNNLIDVTSNGDDAIDIFYNSTIKTGSSDDRILAKGGDQDSSSKESGISVTSYSGLYTGEGNDFISAEATYGLYVTTQSGVDTGFGLDTIIAKGRSEAGIYLSDGSVNTGNNADIIDATSIKDYALVTEEYASINTGRGGDLVDLTVAGGAEGGWYTDGGGSISLGAGNDTLLITSWDVDGSIDSIIQLPGLRPPGSNGPDVAAAFVNGGRGTDWIKFGEGVYNIFHLPNIFNGLYGIIDQDGDILAVTNVEKLAGVGTTGQQPASFLDFPFNTTSYVFNVNSSGDIAQGVPV